MKQYKYKLNRHGRLVRVSPYPRILLMSLLLLAGVGVGIGGAVWWFYADLPAFISSPLSSSKPDDTPHVSWDLLQTLDYKTGEAPPELRQLVGTKVKVPGFIVLLDADLRDAEVEYMTEFLLVPVYGMCIHVPPPPPNLMIHVKQESGIRPQDWMMNGVWLKGTFNIQHVDSDYGAAGFSLSDVTLEVLDMDELIEEMTGDDTNS